MCPDTLQYFFSVRLYHGLFSFNIISLDPTEVKFLLFKPAAHESYLHADHKITHEHWRRQDPPVRRHFDSFCLLVPGENGRREKKL